MSSVEIGIVSRTVSTKSHSLEQNFCSQIWWAITLISAYVLYYDPYSWKIAVILFVRQRAEGLVWKRDVLLSPSLIHSTRECLLTMGSSHSKISQSLFSISCSSLTLASDKGWPRRYKSWCSSRQICFWTEPCVSHCPVVSITSLQSGARCYISCATQDNACSVVAL
jgi:hypothetical protein